MKLKPFLFILIPFFFFAVPLLYPVTSSAEATHAERDINALLGNNDAVVVGESSGNLLFSKHADKKLVPASILKLFTSLVAVHTLGKEYRFKTDFYLDENRNLNVKGYGDPLLTSEALEDISTLLAGQFSAVNDIVVDDSYFLAPIVIPGTSGNSTQPYDAPIGALSVNFNTVNFKTSKDGKLISGEPQTPLLPFILPRIRESSIDKGRIMLEESETAPYAGHMIRWFLMNKGVAVAGKIRTGRVNTAGDRLVIRYKSKTSMEDMIRQLLLFSNNFMANQMLLTAGAVRYGPPATMEKGIKAAGEYAEHVLNIKKGELDIIEGSGISRQNRISAVTFLKVLTAFRPYRHLMRKDGRVFYKTGNLDGVSTRAGYIRKDNGDIYCYVIMINTPGKSSKPVIDKLVQLISAP